MKKLFIIILTFFIFIQLHAQEIPVRWLNPEPEFSSGYSWGIPLEKGQTLKSQKFILKNSSGDNYPIQSWPLAYWPDGSIKWSGMAVSLPAEEKGPFTLIGSKD